jgi:hypothetical protein
MKVTGWCLAELWLVIWYLLSVYMASHFYECPAVH